MGREQPRPHPERRLMPRQRCDASLACHGRPRGRGGLELTADSIRGVSLRGCGSVSPQAVG